MIPRFPTNAPIPGSTVKPPPCCEKTADLSAVAAARMGVEINISFTSSAPVEVVRLTSGYRPAPFSHTSAGVGPLTSTAGTHGPPVAG
jgi:hypothetical protein